MLLCHVCGFSYATVDHKAFHLFTFSVEVSMRKTKTPVSYKSQVHFGPQPKNSSWGFHHHFFEGKKKMFPWHEKQKASTKGDWSRWPFFGMVSSQGSLSRPPRDLGMNEWTNGKKLGWIHHTINEQQRSRSRKREHFWDVPNPQLIKELLRLAEKFSRGQGALLDPARLVGYWDIQVFLTKNHGKTKNCLWNDCIKKTWWYGRNIPRVYSIGQHHRIANKIGRSKKTIRQKNLDQSPDNLKFFRCKKGLQYMILLHVQYMKM